MIAAFRHHDRIDHEVGQLQRFHRRGHRFDYGRVGQHAGFHRIAPDIETTASICAVTKSGPTTCTPLTPIVF